MPTSCVHRVMNTRIWMLIAFALLALLVIGTINVFLVIDSSSHSASDTLLPFVITMGPVWAVAIYAAQIVLRSPARGR